ncbi:hypothetical protein ACJQWK_06229 [Exserohilum turcicum]
MSSYRQPPLRPLPPSTENTGYPSQDDRYAQDEGEEQILVHFDDESDRNTAYERQTCQVEPNIGVQRTVTKRSSRSFTGRMSRQRSRRIELRSRPGKPGITVDTSFTRHRGEEPHQVFPRDSERSTGSVRKSPWFGLGRNSTKNKGLGISKGTPQPEHLHQKKQSMDRNDIDTATSMASSNKSWQEISPWDRRIPIGISVPTDSISDFSTLHANRPRAGSDNTLVTPSIIITPAAVKSVWSPDTPYTESDYTPSIYSRYQSTFANANVPPVPALPAGVSQANSSEKDARRQSTHVRNDTLDSAGTAFEEDDDSRRKERIMSTGTVFEEDITPLTEKTAENSLAIDTSMVPTPRRSQGWWNVITTPFVATPKSATWPDSATNGDRTPDVPKVPVQYGMSKAEPSRPPRSPLHPMAASTASAPVESEPEKPSDHQTPPEPQRAVTSPLSTMSASPVVGTAAIGTVLMPRQVQEPQQINVNIELQDRRPLVESQPVRANYPPTIQQVHISAPAAQPHAMTSSTTNANSSSQNLPVFAPPPKVAQKGSHWSYDNASRSSSHASSHDLKGRKQHRKVCDMASMWPFGKKKKQNQHGEVREKKKKRGVCFWGCCCCLVFFILLAIIIPVVVVVTRKSHDDSKPTATVPSGDVGNQWLNRTDYPPMPVGVLTIAQPEVVEEESGCVAPTTLWSCALPKEQQQSIAPNKPDQPNFKIEITFENGSVAELPKAQRARRAANPVSAGALIRSLLHARAAPSPSPAPPSTADMSFIGQTTDGNSAPFEGEETGLLISMKDPSTSAPRLAKRVDPADPTNITGVIPPPMLASDGTAAPANLLPYPSAQPLRLYNRGKDNEHYGFYSYYDRSIFLKQINGTNRGGNPADTDGGSTKDAAKLRCTYAQTRFLVQIWTRSKDSKPLLQKSASTSSTADAFKRPGTFPYPVTITIDRHGGDAAKKNLYCYEMEDNGTIKNEDSKKFFQFEDRGFGGNLVRGTQGQENATGPIDGGTGGCRCQWQNWLN